MRSNAEARTLAQARFDRVAALGWRSGSIVLLVSALMALALGGIIVMTQIPHVAAWAMFGVAATFIAFGVGGFARARRHEAAMRAGLDAAWEAVAEEVLKGGELTAGTLAQAMYTDEAHAEHMLASLSTRGRARVEVGDDAELRYRVDVSAESPVDAPADPPAKENDDERPSSRKGATR